MHWKSNNTKVLFTHPRITLVEDEVQLPSGKETEYLRFEDIPDYPTVVAVRGDGKILLTQEYTYPTSQILLQFPEGSQEKGEDILVTAKRELLEEAGVKAEKWQLLGKNLAEHRRSTAINHVYLAEVLTEVARVAGDLEEQGISSVWLTEEEVWQKIASGEIIQKNALAAWAMLQAYFKRAKSN